MSDSHRPDSRAKLPSWQLGIVPVFRALNSFDLVDISLVISYPTGNDATQECKAWIAPLNEKFFKSNMRHRVLCLLTSHSKSVVIRGHPWLRISLFAVFICVSLGLLGPRTLSNASAADFLAGADFSHLKFFEDRGILYKQKGQPTDGLAILKSKGINCIRLRLFTSTSAQAQSDPYNYINNLDYTIPLALRVKAAGLQFLLDFHYSDSWADPQKQNKPAAWTNLTFIQLQQQMRDYNSNAITAFKAAGAMPDYVQIGNEITGGILWSDGHVSGNTNASWSNLGALIKSAIQGVQDASGAKPPKIMIHIDRGGDWATTQWFFDNLLNQHISFDIIGESYYPWWHGDLAALSNCLNNAAQRYRKPIVVAETAYPWTDSVPASYNPNLGLPMTAAGQVQYTLALASIVKAVPDGFGAGIFWWGTEYVHLEGYNLASFDKTSFFDSDGNALPIVSAFGQLAAPLKLQATFSNDRVSLQWPFSGAGMKLTQTSNLVPGAAWTVVTNPVQNTGTVFSIPVPLGTSSATFYRLQAN
jgi:arabinogalactan endo-1,4-beta-galactosidase